MFILTIRANVSGAADSVYFHIKLDTLGGISMGRVLKLTYALANSKFDTAVYPVFNDSIERISGPEQYKGSSYALLNGEESKSCETGFHYLIRFRYSGEIELPAASVTVENQTYTTPEYRVTVRPVEIDMSALEDMTPIFGYPEAQLSFKDCVDLDSVKVNNLKLRSNSFSGCTSLVKVNGSVDVSEGYAAFQGCNNSYTSGFDIAATTNKTNKLYTITLSNTEIAEDAFNGCTYLSDIKMDGKQVAPTSIGNRAFQDVLALQYMDLSKAATIGKQAFKNAKNYVGTSKTNDIITVIVPKIMSESFANTGISKIEFTQATSFENSFLSGSEKVVHVKFVKPFEVTGSTVWAKDLFGPDPDTNGTTNVTFFYAEGQKYLNGRTLSLPYKSGNSTKYTTYNFWDVQKN